MTPGIPAGQIMTAINEKTAPLIPVEHYTDRNFGIFGEPPRKHFFPGKRRDQ
jgi:hypothetical protein